MIHDLGEFDGICGLVSLIVAVATCRSNFTPTGAWDKIRHTKAGWFARWQNFVDAPQKMTQTQTFWWTSPFFMVNSYTHPVDWKLCFFSRFSPILVGIHWNFHILSQDDHILLGPFYGQWQFSRVNFYQASTADGSQLPLWCSESGESSPGPTTDLFNEKPWSFSGNTAFFSLFKWEHVL